MYWNASAMRGYTIEASDGELGSVSDFLFEDTSWIIRWLVVDTGKWLPGRKVLLPISALGQADPARRELAVTLTKQQVKDSPDIAADEPVSRQMEHRLYSHYEWEPYWDVAYFPPSNPLAAPYLAPPFAAGSKPLHHDPEMVADPVGDPHLRSAKAVTGYHIHATDGEIGHVEDFIVDDERWSIRYVTVDTRNWWPGRRVLISPRSVREIDWENRLMHLDIDRQHVKDSPPYDPSIAVDEVYDRQFTDYYNWPSTF
jgi:hypothetical protein